MDQEGRTAAVQIVLGLAGCALLLAAALIAAFEPSPGKELAAAGPWLAATVLLWGTAALLERRVRTRRRRPRSARRAL